jgi:hypothetical protein
VAGRNAGSTDSAEISALEMNRITLILFVIVQSVSQIAYWTWPLLISPKPISKLGVALWIASYLLSMPGNFLSGYLIHRFLWMGPLTLTQLKLIDTLMTVLFNAALWTIIGLGVRHLYRVIANAKHRKSQIDFS